VLVRNLDCYMPVLPIAQAFALAVVSFCTRTTYTSVHDAIQNYEQLLFKVKKQRLILIGQLLLASMLLIIPILIYYYRYVVNRSFQSVINYVFALIKQSTDDMKHDTTPPCDKTVVSEKAILICSEDMNENENDKESKNDEEEMDGAKYETIRESGDHAASTPTFLLKDKTDLCGVKDLVRMEQREDRDIHLVAKKGSDDESSTDSSEHQLHIDDSGIGVSLSRVLSPSDNYLCHSPNHISNASGKESERSLFSFPTRSAQRMCSVMSYSEIADTSQDSISDSDMLTHLNENEIELDLNLDGNEKTELDRKTVAAIRALKDSFHECRVIDTGLEKLRLKSDSVRGKLHKIMVQIEETDV